MAPLRDDFTSDESMIELPPTRGGAVIHRPNGWDDVGTPRPGDQPAKVANVVCMADVRPERLRWLWPGYLPVGKLVVIEGDPGLGKSSLTCDLAARVSTGQPMPVTAPGPAADATPGAVLMISLEDDLASTIYPRLKAAGADFRRVHAFPGVKVFDAKDGQVYDRPFMMPDDLAELDALVRVHRARLVIIDPLMAAMSGAVNTYRDQDVRRVLSQLSALANDTDATIVLVRHLNKARTGNAITAGGGSIGIIGAARVGITVGADPDDPDRRLVAISKSNLAIKADTIAYRLVSVDGTDVARVEWDGTSTYTADDLVRPAMDGEERPASRLDEAKDFLRAELMEGPRPARQIIANAKTHDISEKTLRRGREALGIKPNREGYGQDGVWYWSLPPIDADPKDDQPTAKAPVDARCPDTGTNGRSWAAMDINGPDDGSDQGWTDHVGDPPDDLPPVSEPDDVPDYESARPFDIGQVETTDDDRVGWWRR